MLSFVVNGTTDIAENGQQGDPVHYTDMSLATVWELAAGDYVEVVSDQDCGATLTVYGFPTGLADTGGPEFGMVKLP
jgi:hypothetical protein